MNIIQPVLVFDPPLEEPEDKSIPARFARFHDLNPGVYDCLVNLARQVMSRNANRKIGVAMLYEVLRWNFYLTTDSKEEYKLPNEFRACYSRKIMEQEQDLKGCFHIRKSIADQESSQCNSK